MPEWLNRLLHPDGPRVHAFVTIAACVTLCLATLLLSGAAARGRAVQVELTGVVAALSALVGYVYGRGKAAAAQEGPKP